MWKKISARPETLAVAAGLAAVIAFPPFSITSAALLTPIGLILAIDRCTTVWQAARVGFALAITVMLGAFYWVVYVLHVFGSMPWIAAGALYLLFCGLGALNFPLFSAGLFRIHQGLGWLRLNAAWYALGIPAFFVVVEFLIPKLFPWYLGHALYRTLWLNQIVEITGSAFLTFLIFSWGSLAAATFLGVVPRSALTRAWVFPVTLTLICVAFSGWRLLGPQPATITRHVGLVQANIGSLEKRRARQGSLNPVQHTLERHLTLSQQLMAQTPKPDLLLWPETAMPFSLKDDYGWAVSVRKAVREWKTPLITGGYAAPAEPPWHDYNAAFLLEPMDDSGTLHTQIYHKNILLAFGEYFPGGELFPAIYRWIPQVSNFRRGTDQQVFTLLDGTRIGVTICYEAIVPAFFRKVAAQGVHAVVNLTNDSWFGPTSEPYQHAALAVFRAIETRTPLIRVTNTGTSFAVDARGVMSRRTLVFNEGLLNLPVELATDPRRTVYLRWGDWFAWLMLAAVGFFLTRARFVPSAA